MSHIVCALLRTLHGLRLTKMRFFLIGYMGAGKSFWGKQLAQRYHIPFIDLDEFIETENGITITEYFKQYGEAAFREEEHKRLKELINKMPLGVIACGGGTPCFHNNMALMNASGITLFLNTTLETIHERLRKEFHHRPLLQHASNLYEHIKTQLANRLPVYEQAQIILAETQIQFPHFDLIFKPYV